MRLSSLLLVALLPVVAFGAAVKTLTGGSGGSSLDQYGITQDLKGYWLDRHSWSNIQNADWMEYDVSGMPQWKADYPNRGIDLAGPLIPHDMDGVNINAELTSVIAGNHDNDYISYGNNIALNSPNKVYLRLWWEFNLNNDYNETLFKQAWKRAVPKIRAGFTTSATPGQKLYVVYCPNAEGRSAVTAYPGDDVVDVIASDVYAWIWGRTDSPSPRELLYKMHTTTFGLDWLTNFSKTHNKPAAIGEWSNVASFQQGSSSGAGDSADVVFGLYDWAQKAGNVIYMMYFNLADGNIGMTLDDAPHTVAALLDVATPLPPADPTISNYIYDDTVHAPWYDTSYDWAPNFADPYAYAGSYSVSLQLVYYRGIYLTTSVPVDKTKYTHIEFVAKWTGCSLFFRSAKSDWTWSQEIQINNDAGGWQKYKIPLSQISASGDPIVGLIWQANTDSQDVVGTLYIDELRFTGPVPTVAPTSCPTPKPTVCPTVAPTKAPTPKPTAAPTVAPTPSPEDICATGVTVTQTRTSSWNSSGVTYSQWTLNVKTSASITLYDVKLKIDVPSYLTLDSLWGFKKDNGSLYALESYQLPIPASTTRSNAGYIIGQASALPISVAHAQCTSTVKNCKLNAVLTRGLVSNSTAGLLIRSYSFTFTNVGTAATNKVKINVVFPAGSYPSDFSNLYFASTAEDVVASGQTVLSFTSSVAAGKTGTAAFNANVPTINSKLAGYNADPTFEILSYDCK